MWPTTKAGKLYEHELVQYEYMLNIHRMSANYFALVPRLPVEGGEGGEAGEGIQAIEARSLTHDDMLDDDEFERANALCEQLFGKRLTREEVRLYPPSPTPLEPLTRSYTPLEPLARLYTPLEPLTWSYALDR